MFTERTLETGFSNAFKHIFFLFPICLYIQGKLKLEKCPFTPWIQGQFKIQVTIWIYVSYQYNVKLVSFIQGVLYIRSAPKIYFMERHIFCIFEFYTKLRNFPVQSLDNTGFVKKSYFRRYIYPLPAYSLLKLETMFYTILIQGLLIIYYKFL